jgi:hypothetical protein
MSLSQKIVNVVSNPTLLSLALSEEPAYEQSLTISVQNLDQTANIYLGNENIYNYPASSSYGLKLAPGDVISLTLSPREFLYGISDATGASGSQVAVLQIIR